MAGSGWLQTIKRSIVSPDGGYRDLALREIPIHDPLRARIEEIKSAGERASALTRQLLAFSRKQLLQPVVMDLNSIVTGMGKMLPRVIGEDIELRFELAADLGKVKADPGADGTSPYQSRRKRA